MKILPQTLARFHEFSGKWADTFKAQFPNGQELSAILQDTTVDEEIIWLLQKYLEFNEDELKYFCKRMNIDEKSTIYQLSRDLTNSHFIFNSSNINQSNYINRSEDIYNSNYVIDSQNVKNSNNIFDSVDVCDCNFIIHSKKVEQSNYINRSMKIEWSNYISNSVDILESSYSYNSQDLQDCSFCGFTKKSKNCSFCFGIERKEYLIFNKEVAPATYVQWNDELSERLNAEAPAMIAIRDNYDLSNARFIVTPGIVPMFKNLSSDFKSWLIGSRFFDYEVCQKLFMYEI